MNILGGGDALQLPRSVKDGVAKPSRRVAEACLCLVSYFRELNPLKIARRVFLPSRLQMRCARFSSRYKNPADFPQGPSWVPPGSSAAIIKAFFGLTHPDLIPCRRGALARLGFGTPQWQREREGLSEGKMGQSYGRR